MTRDLLRRATRRTLPVLLVLAAGTLGVATSASAEDPAWSVSPADASGAADGRTRFELTVEPGASGQDAVVVANASTVEQTFSVYAADAFNTADGGYDLQAGGTAPVDSGAWVSLGSPTVTVPALSSQAVPFTVAVPAGATPGDHPAGIVVSPAQPDQTGGVLVDTRVAVRLNVRVPGELAPALTVRGVDASFGGNAVPFGSGPTTVSYEVVNTGNVKIIGQPRVRITGPFGMELTEIRADDTREVLPGQSFTVTTELPGVAPVAIARAVVDVDMAAAPGPETEIPLVSSTASTTFAAMPWTGLAVVLVIALVIWWLIRRARYRKREGQLLWQEMVEASGGSTGHVVAGTVLGLGLAVALGVGALLAGTSPASAAEPTGLRLAGECAAPASCTSLNGGGITLHVPSAGGAPSPSPSPSSSTTPPPAGGGSSSSGGGKSDSGAPGRSPVPGADDSADDTSTDAPSDAPTAPVGTDQVTPRGAGADLTWQHAARRFTPVQWSLIGLGGAGAATTAVVSGRLLLSAWRARAALRLGSQVSA
ncbi:WxL protein peptidoglycan domain-containing protein [Cellulomonas hominis]